MKIYSIPSVEILDLQGEKLMYVENPSGKPQPGAPARTPLATPEL